MLFLAISFATLNSQTVIVEFYFNNISLPLGVIISISLLTGCAIGGIADIFYKIRLNIRIRKLEKKVNEK